MAIMVVLVSGSNINWMRLLIIITKLLYLTWLSWSISRINVSRVARVRARSFLSGIWILLDLLSGKIVSLFANACIKSLDKIWMFRTCRTFSVYSDVSFMTETAAFIKILIEATFWWNKRVTWLCSSIIYLSIGASSANSFYSWISKRANTCLFGRRIFLVFSTNDSNASVIDKRKS